MLMNGQQQSKLDPSSLSPANNSTSSSSSSSPNMSSSSTSSGHGVDPNNGSNLQHQQQQQHLAAVYKSLLASASSGGMGLNLANLVSLSHQTVNSSENSPPLAPPPPPSQSQQAAILSSLPHHYLSQHGHQMASHPTSMPPPPPAPISAADEHQHLLEYMHQLLEEKEKLKELFHEPFNILLPLSARLIDEEINRIRVDLFQLGNKDAISLPEPVGQVVQMTEKLYVPVKDHPEFNFVGRILGPRGMTAKQLEQETGCKIMVRGKGSMRDKAKEEQMKGKPNWEHLNDELHVLITVEDTKNRAEVKLKRAVEEIKKLLVPSPEGEDELKKKQLMELAIINGTYRDGTKMQQKLNQILIPTAAGSPSSQNQAAAMFASLASLAASTNRSPPTNPLGQPLIISPRIAAHTIATGQPGTGGTGSTPQSSSLTTDPTTGLIYAHIPFYSAIGPGAGPHHTDISLLEYSGATAATNAATTAGLDFSQAGPIKGRFATVSAMAGAPVRAHPYARVALS